MSNTTTSLAPLDHILSVDPSDEKLLVIRAYPLDSSPLPDFAIEDVEEHKGLYVLVEIDELLQKDINQRYKEFFTRSGDENLQLTSKAYLDGERYRPTFAYLDVRLHSDEDMAEELSLLTEEGFAILDKDDFLFDEDCTLSTDHTCMYLTLAGLFFSSLTNTDLTWLTTHPLRSTLIHEEIEQERERAAIADAQFQSQIQRLTEQRERTLKEGTLLIESIDSLIQNNIQSEISPTILSFASLKRFIYNRFDVPSDKWSPSGLKSVLGPDFIDLDLRNRENWELLGNMYQIDAQTLASQKGVTSLFKLLSERLTLEGLEKLLNVKLIRPSSRANPNYQLSINGKYYPYVTEREISSTNAPGIALRRIIGILNDLLKESGSVTRLSLVGEEYILFIEPVSGDAITTRLPNGIQIKCF